MDRVKHFDLAETTVRAVNEFLHHELPHTDTDRVKIANPQGFHNIAVGMTCDAEIEIAGHAGYFIAGMNQLADVTVRGNVGWSVGENMMSGRVRVCGHASQCAGASAHGGLLIIDGDASSRCGISLKGGTIIVGGSVGHFSAFMAQAGTLLVHGDAGPNLGDSLYEATIYVGGDIHSLGADAEIVPLASEDHQTIATLLESAGLAGDPAQFTRVSSARTLYHWNSDAHQEY